MLTNHAFFAKIKVKKIYRMEIIIAACAIVIIIALCKIGIEALLNIILGPLLIPVMAVIAIYIWIKWGFVIALLVILASIALYIIKK